MISNKKHLAHIAILEKKITRLESELANASNLKAILDKMSSITFNGSFIHSDLSGSILSSEIILPNDVARYVDDILGGTVVKQEANKCIVIELDGTVKTGLTKQAVDKNFSYNLVRKEE